MNFPLGRILGTLKDVTANIALSAKRLSNYSRKSIGQSPKICIKTVLVIRNRKTFKINSSEADTMQYFLPAWPGFLTSLLTPFFF